MRIMTWSAMTTTYKVGFCPAVRCNPFGYPRRSNNSSLTKRDFRCHQGYRTWVGNINGEGSGSAQISIICGNNPLAHFNSLMIEITAVAVPFTIKGLRALRRYIGAVP